MSNPYSWRTLVRDSEMFYGRSKELGEVTSRLSGNVPLSISIVGSPRIGKSSLLWHVSRPESEALPPDIYQRCCFLCLDSQEVGPLSTDKILKWVLRELGVKTSLREENVGTLKDLLKEKLHELEHNHKHLVLVFDEFDVAVRYMSAESLDYLRSLAKYNVTYIIATRQPLCDISAALKASPFSNIFTIVPVGPLTREEAHLLVTEPATRSGIAFTDEDVAFILDTAGCHPYLLQVTSYYTFRARSRRNGHLDFDAIKDSVTTDTLPFIQRIFYSIPESAREALITTLNGRNLPPLIYDELRMQAVLGDDGEISSRLLRTYAQSLAPTDQPASQPESSIDEVDRLLSELEQEMRSFLTCHLRAKYGHDWPYNLDKKNHNKFLQWLHRMPAEAQSDALKWQDILRYTDFPDPFQIISWEWGDLKTIFRFGNDVHKSKRRLDERRELLTRVRNNIRHTRSEDLTSLDLDRAQLFCRELLTMIQNAQMI